MSKHHDISSKKVACRAVKSGISVGHVAKIHKCDRTTIWRWRKKSNEGQNITNLKPLSRSGRPVKISEDKIFELRNDILKPATKFGFETDFWTSKRIQIHLKRKFRTKITRRTICRWLRKSGMSYHKPERIYYEANKLAQKNWLKIELPKILKFTKSQRGLLYFEDEASIQLSPVVGKTWGPIGKKIVRTVTGNKASVAAMSAITINGSLIFNLFQKKITSTEVINFLDQILKHHPRRKIVIVMDRARSHTSKATKLFIEGQKRLTVFYLPARSPRLNPDEKVWSHLKHQELRDHQATSKKSLTRVARKKLSAMSKNKKLVKGIFFRSDVAKYMS